MFFALITLFSALMLASVAGWFSIVGIMSIYAGAPMHAALVMGIVLELAKLVTASWIYRNWGTVRWTLRGPLIYAIIALMIATSISVFGFLTKSHLEQGAATIDNTAKVERLDQQIAREKSTIQDDEKVISQLDATVNSFIGKDNADRAVSVRRTQLSQRKQLREEIDAAHKRIDVFSDDRLKLTSEVRALQLEVGPIRYIAELFSSDNKDSKNIESAVKMFTLLIVSTLDPLAIILLIAANHSILRYQDEKNKKSAPSEQNREVIERGDAKENNKDEDTVLRTDIEAASLVVFDSASISNKRENISTPSIYESEKTDDAPVYTEVYEENVADVEVNDEEKEILENKTAYPVCVSNSVGVSSKQDVQLSKTFDDNSVFNGSPLHSQIPSVSATAELVSQQNSAVISGILGIQQHFIPQQLHAEKENTAKIVKKEEALLSENTMVRDSPKTKKSLRTLSWLTEFKKD